MIAKSLQVKINLFFLGILVQLLKQFQQLKNLNINMIQKILNFFIYLKKQLKKILKNFLIRRKKYNDFIKDNKTIVQLGGMKSIKILIKIRRYTLKILKIMQ